MEYQRKIEELENYLRENTSIPDEVLAENITTEWFLTADEAIQYGMCERIIESLDEVI